MGVGGGGATTSGRYQPVCVASEPWPTFGQCMRVCLVYSGTKLRNRPQYQTAVRASLMAYRWSSLLVLGRHLVGISAGTLPILSEFYRRFSQSPPKNFGILLQLGQGSFLPDHNSYVAYPLDAIVSKYWLIEWMNDTVSLIKHVKWTQSLTPSLCENILFVSCTPASVLLSPDCTSRELYGQSTPKLIKV
jgi:hypothetical protein